MDKSSSNSRVSWLCYVESIVKYTYTNGITHKSHHLESCLFLRWDNDAHRSSNDVLFSVSVSLFSQIACFLLFLPSVSLSLCLLARMTTIIINTLSLSSCSIKSYEKNNFSNHSSIVPLYSFFTFVRLLSLLYTQLTTTKTAAVVVAVVAGPMIIGN